jgi:hypothetical protein
MAPQSAFVDAVAEPFEQLFLEAPVDSGNVNQKAIIEGAWDALEKAGSLVHDAAAKDVRDVQWQDAEHEKVKVAFPRPVPLFLTEAE